MLNFMLAASVVSIMFSIAGLYYINKYTSRFGPIKTLNLLFISFLLVSIIHVTSFKSILHVYHTALLPFFQLLILVTYIIEIKVIKCQGNWLPSDILNNLPDMLWVKDKTGKFLYANDSTCKKLLLTNKESVIGQTSLDIAARNAEKNITYDFGEICDDTDTIIISNRRSGKFLEVGRIADRFLAMQVIKAPIYDSKGNIWGTVGCGRDLTYDLKDHVKLQKLYDNGNFEDFERLFEEHKYKHLMVERKKCSNCTSFEDEIEV